MYTHEKQKGINRNININLLHKSINTKPRKETQGTKLNNLDIALKSSLEEHIKTTVEAIDNDTITGAYREKIKGGGRI